MAEIESELGRTKALFASSRTELANAKKTIAVKDTRLQATEKELASTRELLQGQVNLYKNEIASSLENTTMVMDLVSKENDGLIESLNAKITVLEGSLAKTDKGRVREGAKSAETEHRLNDKVIIEVIDKRPVST